MNGALMEFNGKRIHMSVRLSALIIVTMQDGYTIPEWLDVLLNQWGI